MGLRVGIAGSARHACVALRSDERVLGICEQERVTRLRGAGVNRSTGLPDEALDLLLTRARHSRREVDEYVWADDPPPVPGTLQTAPHKALASAAFLTAGFSTATILICDETAPGMSVWDGSGTDLTPRPVSWSGPSLVELYSQCAAALGFAGPGSDQRMEALARLTPRHADDRAARLFRPTAEGVEVAPDWAAKLEQWVSTTAGTARAETAAALQSQIGACLLALLQRIRNPSIPLCVSGSLFANSHFNSLLKQQAPFSTTVIPVAIGTAGRALGAILDRPPVLHTTVSPYLGPSFSPDEIKSTLDNCKLTYEWVPDGRACELAVNALKHGHLVGLFDDGMEWGTRALGNRSILANPFAPYALDHLNRYLKQRDEWRGYALSGLEADVHRHFEGPSTSPFMECDYTPKDPERFRHVLPAATADVRVQTVGADAPRRLRSIIEAFGAVSESAFVVNTSFNGFQEPIVCTPRDAIRVFYGTGIDMLVLGGFILAK